MKALFVFAHPDDETFSSGGTIVKLVRAGHQVKIVSATKGEAGEVGKPPLTTKEKLGQLREKELKKAAKVLGASGVLFLGLIDGTLKDVPLKKLTQDILKILELERPDLVFTFDKTGVSNHPDHVAISRATTKAFEDYKKLAKKSVKLYHTVVPKSYLKQYEKVGLVYSAFGKMKGVSDKQITTIVDVEEVYPLKVKALKQHKTQHQDWERFLKRADLINLKKEFFLLISENWVV